MYIGRDKNACHIYHSSFLEDLFPYTFTEDSTGFGLRYEDGTVSSGNGNRLSFINTIINNNQPNIENLDTNDIWLPAIIDTGAYVNNKQVLMGHVIGNPIYGIEDVISFSYPRFQNWTNDKTNLKLSIDWFINSDISPTDIEYGVLCWYKKHTNNNLKNITECPVSVPLLCSQDITYTQDNIEYKIPKDSIVYKVKNTTLRKSTENYINITESVSLNENALFDLSKVPSYLDTKFFKLLDHTNTISNNLSDYVLWVADGEAYSFYNSPKDKLKRNSKNYVSQTYLSPSLYHIYRSIYHALTINRVRPVSPGSSPYTKSQSSRLKKLSYFLASSPLIDRVSINKLLDPYIQTEVTSYINGESTETEKQDLINIIAKIFDLYRQESLNLGKQTLANNYIRTKKDLFNKLSQKYSAYVYISGNHTFSFNPTLPNGAHALIDIGVRTFVSKASTGPFYNNCGITLGNIHAYTNMDPNSVSECKFRYLSQDGSIDLKALPLSDISITNPDRLNLDIGPDLVITAGGSNVNNTDARHEFDIPLLYNNNVQSYWFMSEGYDCIRFSDYNIAPASRGGAYWRLPTSTQNNPTMYTKEPGFYTIDCVATASGALKKADSIDVYVVDESGEYATGKVPSPTSFSNNYTINNYKCLCPNWRQIAFNKRGMVWFIDTDMHVTMTGTASWDSNPERCVDKQIPLEYFTEIDSDTGSLKADIWDKDAPLYIDFQSGNTIIKLSYVSLQNMRDKNKTHDGSNTSYAACAGFFEDKIYLKRDTFSSLTSPFITGASRYYRKWNQADTYYKYYKNTNGDWVKGDTVDFNFPVLSTVYSPTIYSYGGYSQQVIKDIGIDIPYHPIKSGGQTQVLKSTPNNLVWDGSSGLVNSDPAAMPTLTDHNDMGGVSPNIRCHLKPVELKNSLNFIKGFFHPNQGWLNHNNTGYLHNKTAVKKYKTEDYGTYIFRGFGVSEMKAAYHEQNNISRFVPSVIKMNGSIPYNQTYGVSPNYGYRLPNGHVRAPMVYPDDMYVDSDTAFFVDFACNFPYSFNYRLIDHPDTSSLNIQDIEIRLNFLNYPNPKNLVVYLEVSGNPLPNPDYTQIYHNYNSNNTSNNTDLKNYINSLSEMNGSNKLYLLNAESIDNYGSYFSIKFSDNCDNNISLFDRNKIAGDNALLPSQKIANSDDTVRPTLTSSGYSDQDIAKYSNAIINNNIVIPAATFSKFKGMKLEGTVFTLHVGVIDDTEKMSVKDFVISNNELSGLVGVENIFTSSDANNNLCSWELIVHTTKNTKFNNKDVLGLINYYDDKTYDGYNFIYNFTGKEYLLPLVNMNAPFPYLTGINTCSFTDAERSASTLTYRPIVYPGFYLPFTPFFSLVGAFVAIFEIQQVFARGGRSDPIINMLTNIRMQQRQEQVESAVFQPIYDNYGFPDKVPITLSKDGVSWVHTEASMFRYDNSPVLQKNKYKYIKLNKSMAISRFLAKRIKNISAIIDQQDIVASITISGNSIPSGLTISDLQNNSHTFLKNDLVRVNGKIYVVNEDNWSTNPDMQSIKSLCVNKTNNNQTITTSYVNAKQIFMIDGARAYYFFEKNENVLYSGDASGSTTIVDKALIKSDGKYKTILTVSNTLNYDNLEFYKNDQNSNVLLVYKDHHTVYDDSDPNKNNTVGKWSFEKTVDEKLINFPIFYCNSTLGEGSWGYGSNFLEPEVVDKIGLYDNKITELYETINSKYNSKYKPYNITLIDQNNTTTQKNFDPSLDTSNDGLIGYAYSPEDLELSQYYNALIDSGLSKETLKTLQKIINRNTMYMHQTQSPFFMELRSDKFKDIAADSYGEIYIENDFIAKASISKLNNEEKDIIHDRLVFIETTLVAKNQEYNKQDIKSDNLRAEIDTLSLERSHLRQALELDNLAIEGLPVLARTITQEGDGGPISISYTKQNYYWINLEKNQQCYLSQDSLPKILEKITYNCVPIVENYLPPECNSVCGFSRSPPEGASANPDEIISGYVEYSLPQSIINAEKNKYPNVTEWKSDTYYWNYEKKFFLVCSDPEGGQTNTRDVLVYVTEKYLYPSDQNMFHFKNNLELDDVDNVKIRFRNIPRKLKTIDPIYYVYRYDYYGNLYKDITPPPGGFVPSNLVFWHCFGHNDNGAIPPSITADKFYGMLVEPPDFFKMQNEMIFRAFYGSIDRVENKNSDISATKEMWEWIPYEYYNIPLIIN